MASKNNVQTEIINYMVNEIDKIEIILNDLKSRILICKNCRQKFIEQRKDRASFCSDDCRTKYNNKVK